jgi:hypothetical protein
MTKPLKRFWIFTHFAATPLKRGVNEREWGFDDAVQHVRWLYDSVPP